MSKTKPYIISIPEPCSENWDRMTPAEQGRFCGACQRTITDFSGMDDAELLRYFAKHKHFCGRFTAGQLDRPLQPELPRPAYWVVPIYKKIAAGLLLMAASFDRSWAQQKTITIQQPAAPKPANAFMVISGHLIDLESQKPLPGQSVWLRGADLNEAAITNKWGGFTFRVPARHWSDTLTLGADNQDEQYYIAEKQVVPTKWTTEIQMCRLKAEALDPVEIADRVPRIEEPRRTMGIPVRYNQIDARPPGYKMKRLWYRVTHPFKRNKTG
jgi:hypothetical protein